MTGDVDNNDDIYRGSNYLQRIIFNCYLKTEFDSKCNNFCNISSSSSPTTYQLNTDEPTQRFTLPLETGEINSGRNWCHMPLDRTALCRWNGWKLVEQRQTRQGPALLLLWEPSNSWWNVQIVCQSCCHTWEWKCRVWSSWADQSYWLVI